VGRVVVVGGDGGRGVVTAASYEARKYGVRAAMPGSLAREKLRGVADVLFISPSRGEYERASGEVRAVLESDLPILEAASIDEFMADITPLLSGGRAGLYEGGIPGHEADPLLIARHVASRVERECGLPASVGIGSSRLLAKMATDEAKPRGALWVRPGGEESFLAGLPIDRIPGVGAKTGPRLHALGVHEIGDVARVGVANLAAALGEKFATWLERCSRGIDGTSVGGHEAPRSIGSEETFDADVADEGALLAIASEQAERVAMRLRAEGLRARTVQVKLRYGARRGGFAPGRVARDVFETVTRASSGEPTADGRVIAARARELIREHRRAGAPVRLLGIAAHKLEPEGIPHERQQELFARPSDLPADASARPILCAPLEESPGIAEARSKKITQALDSIRGKFGFEAIQWGSAVRPQTA
jgi:DNA polymerase-4